MLFIEYPKCSACKKAKKWLDEKQISYTDRHIVEENPTYEELKEWYQKSGMPLKKFSNVILFLPNIIEAPYRFHDPNP